jgi:hypothetical protein
MSVPYTAIAKFAYDPDPENASDDLPLQVNEIVTVTEVVDNDWLLGSKTDGSVSGYFPKSFVEPYTEPSQSEAEAEAAEGEVDEEGEDQEQDEFEEKLSSNLDSGNTTTTIPAPIAKATNEPKSKNIELNMDHEPTDFRNKLMSFNSISAPILPTEKPKEESFVKKSFISDAHHSSYIPPSLGSLKPVKKEERKPDAVAGDIITSSNQPEEVEAPRMTLKERMMMLQKQQEEEQKALEAALKRKEEKKKAKHHHHHQDNENVESIAEEVGRSPEAPQLPDSSDSEDDTKTVQRPAIPVFYNISQNEAAEESNQAKEEAYKENQDVEDSAEGEEDAEDDEDEEEEDEEEEEEEDDDHEEEDEEELRKRRLAERMAKLSGGMGMMGMMGMMPNLLTTPHKSKKNKKEKKLETEQRDLPSAIPILPMGNIPEPVMGIPILGTPQMPSETSVQEQPDQKKNIDDGSDVLDTKKNADDDLQSIEGPLVSNSSAIESNTEKINFSDEEKDEEEDTFHDSIESPSKISAEHTSISTPTTEHPYRMQFASPVPPSVPPVPSHAPSTRAVPPPPPPITEPPVTELSAHSITEAPIIPSSLPPSLPKTSSVLQHQALPPQLPTPTIPTGPAAVLTQPAPVPGAVPSIPSPTTVAPAPPSVYPQIPVPGAIPPIPIQTDNLSRNSSVSSRPAIPVVPKTGAPSPPSNFVKRHSQGHPPPPPPPPTESIPAIPETSIPVIQKQLTRTSLDSSVSAPMSVKSSNVPSPTTSHELWWTTGSLPPQLSSTENYYEVDSTEIKKRDGSIVKYLIYYILDVHLTCITLELAYNTSEPERIIFFHESKDKNKGDKKSLIEQYTKYGPLAYNTCVKNLNKSYDGELSDFIFSSLPESTLKPIANKTFGAVVYRNNNGETKFFDDIRPGDILVLVQALFDGSSGIKEIGVRKPHVALVTSFDADKNKIKVIETVNGVLQQGKYKLNKMKSGKLRVFRVVGRDYVGW